MSGVTPPAGCERYDCTDLALPPHAHVMVPFPPELTAGRPYAATHLHGPDIDRVAVDWKRVAYELWTGRRPPPPEGHQYSLDDFMEATRG